MQREMWQNPKSLIRGSADFAGRVPRSLWQWLPRGPSMCAVENDAATICAVCFLNLK